MATNKVTVECPKCGRKYLADPAFGKFNCKVHGDIPFVVVQDPRGEEAQIKIQQLEQRIGQIDQKSISKESVLELIQDVSSKVESSSRIAPEPKQRFITPEIVYVNYRVVDDLNACYLEAEVAFGLFTLFLGITIQGLLNHNSIGNLIFTTIIFLSISIYTFYKSQKRKSDVMKDK